MSTTAMAIGTGMVASAAPREIVVRDQPVDRNTEAAEADGKPEHHARGKPHVLRQELVPHRHRNSER